MNRDEYHDHGRAAEHLKISKSTLYKLARTTSCRARRSVNAGGSTKTPSMSGSYLQKNAKRTEIGTLVDDAMAAIERDNKVLKGVLPKGYARPALDKPRLGEIIDLIATIGLDAAICRNLEGLGYGE